MGPKGARTDQDLIPANVGSRGITGRILHCVAPARHPMRGPPQRSAVLVLSQPWLTRIYGVPSACSNKIAVPREQRSPSPYPGYSRHSYGTTNLSGAQFRHDRFKARRPNKAQHSSHCPSTLDRQEHDSFPKRTINEAIALIKPNSVVVNRVSNDGPYTGDL